MNNLTGKSLAVIALAGAILLMVFFVWPQISGGDAPTEASAPATETATPPAAPAAPAADTPAQPDSAATEPAKPEPAQTEPVKTEPVKTDTAQSEPAKAEPASAPAETAAPAPSFDVLRVEPDGSTVIAGRTLPSSSLEILDGTAAIARSDVDATGDFAVVLDQPLAPGDHQLTLKATGKDGKVVTSEEVATVSVPKAGSGELLAMVTKPGAASRIITAPEAPKPAETAAAAPAETAAEAAKTDKPAEASAETPAAATTAPAATEPAAPADTATAPAAPAAEAPAELRVTAVEIEGDQIYIAGVAKPGTTIRAYADEALVGEALTDPKGNFVADGKQSLSVGSHRIRVDAVDATGKVVLRAEVPFDRPDGEQVAVVAGDTAAPADLAPLGDGSFDKLRDEARKAFALLSGLFEGGKVPAADALAAARSSTEIALKSLSEFHLDASADAAATEIVGRTATAAGKALALLRSYPADGKDLAAGLKDLDALIRQALAPSGGTAQPAPAAPAAPAVTEPATPAAPATAEAPAEAPANTTAEAQAPAATEAEQPAVAPATPDQPKTITQAPLKPSDSSVIIRRGDTLWQISRRVYGQGVRYTTIYLANQGQIKNPDLIEPGQIFSVPEKALDNAEELHRQRLKGKTAP